MKLKKKFICKKKYLNKIKYIKNIKYFNRDTPNDVYIIDSIDNINIHSTKNINFADIVYGFIILTTSCFIYYNL